MGKIDKFKDIELQLTLILGTKELPLSKVLKLKEGDIITLETKVEDYLELRLNGERFGIGELLVANNRIGVRLVDLV